MHCTGIAVLLLFVVTLRGAETFHYKVCSGSERYHDWDLDYQDLKHTYTNCTYVDGDLVILSLKNNETDPSFLKDIREVTGYVLISFVDIRRLVLPNLRIIRGRTLTDFSGAIRYALLVLGNKFESLEFPELREISAGKVKFENNDNLCHLNTVKWEKIVKDISTQPVTIENSASPESCPPCHESCTDGCWGPGPLNCQKYSKINCSLKCYGGRCFGPNEQQCCHSFCAGGCTGPTQRDCFACKDYNDHGVCKEECPRILKNNPATSSLERNPEGKYAYGAICVKDCPEPLLRDSGGACVDFCPDTKKPVDGECVPCGEGPCPRVCREFDGGYVYPENIHQFEGCTVIHGNLIIDVDTFEGYLGRIPSNMHPDALEVFSTVREVTGLVFINDQHPDFKNLSYFRNLEIIHGRQLWGEYALLIRETSLESLNLRSFFEVRRGGASITENPKLCFASEIDWKQIVVSNTADMEIHDNAAEDYCRERGLVCHEECSSHGCWGKDPEDCLSCENYRWNGTCIPDCNATLGIYDAGNRTCELCDSECLECRGPGPDNCTSCLNVRDGPYCVSQCPWNKYNENRKCMTCDQICVYRYNIPEMVGSVFVCIVLLTLCFGVFANNRRNKSKNKDNILLMPMEMTELEGNEPLEPTNRKPNLARLIIIQESDLRIIGDLGCGAFGTVYKGVWVPEGESLKIPVAVKVLRGGSSPKKNKQILEEAYITASVDHPNLLKLLGISMASQLMLVTQLLPLGCLLDYVRSNEDKIGSKPLLSWCSQIAKGMAYLEEKRMVHRDLALRNVLLKTPECIKVTDFGLAKMLDVNEEEYKAEDGKMTIKWLALECFQLRIFTHKSDVWAFGVTIWELLTYGGRPYESTPARKVPELLEKGVRLPQPSTCSIEVYMLMIQCWVLHAESRPTFTELADQFSMMARDPDSYLSGDKHKQLPAFSPSDVDDLIQSIGESVEDSGVSMDAERYLHLRYDKCHGTEADGMDISEHEYENKDLSTQLNTNNSLPLCTESLPGCSSDRHNRDAHSEQPRAPRRIPHPHSVVVEAEVYTPESEKYLSYDPSSSVEDEDYLRPTSSSPDTTVRYVNLPEAKQQDTVDVRPNSFNHDNPDLTSAQRHAVGRLDYFLMIDSDASEQPPVPSTDEESNYVST